MGEDEGEKGENGFSVDNADEGRPEAVSEASGNAVKHTGPLPRKFKGQVGYVTADALKGHGLVVAVVQAESNSSVNGTGQPRRSAPSEYPELDTSPGDSASVRPLA